MTTFIYTVEYLQLRISLKMLLLCMVIVVSSQVIEAKQPNILLIVADDYGWNDIGYHGSKEVQTPYLDQLAAEGIKLENYYVQPLCTPTRSTLMTGRYVIHTGLQHKVIQTCRAAGMPLSDKTIAYQLKALGYNTSMIGKWHLGSFKKDYLPTRRGFQTFFGYLHGREDYYSHKLCDTGTCGVDFYEGEQPTNSYQGQYSTNLFTNQAIKIIKDHNTTRPFFLYMAFQAVHYPLEAPQHYINQFRHIQDPQRRTYLAMVKAMDDGVRKITETIKKRGMWKDTLLIFTTDNGGAVKYGANNAPLRGEKGAFYEGGVRGVGFLSGPRALHSGKINRQLLHVSDWYPTIMNLAGGNALKVPGLDGYDQWEAIVHDKLSNREEIMFDIDPLATRQGKSNSKIFDTGIKAALRSGDWKIITGPPPQTPGWYPEPKLSILQTVFKNITQLIVDAGFALQHLVSMALQLLYGYELPSKNIELYNLALDPEERNDVSGQFPEIVRHLLERMAYYNRTAVPVQWPPKDYCCNPALHNGFWGPWE